jgi:glycosyltransferase involved in cell wall biosynthesis
MPLRIMHVDSGAEWRGGQRQLLLLARTLRERGYEPLIVAAPGSSLVQRLRRAGLATSAIHIRGDWDLVAARRIRALARTWNAGIVHAHDARAHAVALIALLDRPNIPLVVTRRISQPLRGIRRQYASRVGRFLAASGLVRDGLVQSGVDPESIDVVHPGVPRPVVQDARNWRKECRWPRESVLCGVIGAAAADGVDLLTAVAERLTSRARQRARFLLFGGPGGGALRIAGVDAFRVGFVDEIHPALAGADLLVHLATTDGLRTAVIDAMALGVPPIAFAVSGLPELIDPDRTGILVPPVDVDALSSALSRLVLSASARRALAERGAPHAALFSVDAMVNRVEHAYGLVTRPVSSTE